VFVVKDGDLIIRLDTLKRKQSVWRSQCATLSDGIATAFIHHIPSWAAVRLDDTRSEIPCFMSKRSPSDAKEGVKQGIQEQQITWLCGQAIGSRRRPVSVVKQIARTMPFLVYFTT